MGKSYAADKNGGPNLAANANAMPMLVEHEPPCSSSKQVPLLLGEEDYTALIKATESGDTDLVHLLLSHIWENRPSFDLFKMNLQDQPTHVPLPRDLFISYARRCSKHRQVLIDFFLSTGQLEEVAFLLWKDSWALKGSPLGLGGPRIKRIEQAQYLFLETKKHAFESKAAEEHAKLLKIQHELEASTQEEAIFVDSSLSDTIRKCIVLGNHRAAIKLKNEFKVSDRRWYWLKAFALATVRDWDALAKFSKEKRRPPTGYTPFVEACIAADEKGEALKYILKLADPRLRADAYARMTGIDIDSAQNAASSLSLFHTLRDFGMDMDIAQNAAAASSLFHTLRDRPSLKSFHFSA